MRKITSLTKDQEDDLPRFREECRSIALASPVVTDDEMRAAVIRLYASRGLKEPAVFVFADPTQCLWARAILRNAAKKGLRVQLRDQLGVQLRGQLWDQIWDQIGDQLGEQLGEQLGGQLKGQLWGQLKGQLWGQLGGQIRDQLGGQLGDQLWGQLGGQLGDQLKGQLWGQIKGQLGGQLGGRLGGQLRGQLRDQLWDQLGEQLREQLRGRLGGQLRDQIGDQLGEQLREQLRGRLGGQLRDQLGEQLREQLRGRLGGQLRDQLGGQIGVQLMDQLWDQLGAQLRDQIGVQLMGQLWDQLGVQLGGQIRDQLGGQLRDQIGAQLRDQIGVQIMDQLWDQLGVQLGGQLRDQLGGQEAYDTLWFAGGSEFYWIALYKFAQKIGVEYTDEQSAALDAWANYARLCGPLYPYDGVAFVSKRPELLAFDDQQRLHSEIGPAMSFPSGYALHAWHGVRVPAHWIDERDHLDPAEVLACENVEQRAAGMEIVGWAKAIDLLQCKIIDSDPDPDHGDLIELTLPGLSEPGRFLRAYCPRNGLIVEGVPYVSDIDSRPINTVKAAQAWSFGVATDAFTYPTAVS